MKPENYIETNHHMSTITDLSIVIILANGADCPYPEYLLVMCKTKTMVQLKHGIMRKCYLKWTREQPRSYHVLLMWSLRKTIYIDGTRKLYREWTPVICLGYQIPYNFGNVSWYCKSSHRRNHSFVLDMTGVKAIHPIQNTLKSSTTSLNIPSTGRVVSSATQLQHSQNDKVPTMQAPNIPTWQKYERLS